MIARRKKEEGRRNGGKAARLQNCVGTACSITSHSAQRTVSQHIILAINHLKNGSLRAERLAA